MSPISLDWLLLYVIESKFWKIWKFKNYEQSQTRKFEILSLKPVKVGIDFSQSKTPMLGWKRTFAGRRPLVKDNLWWKITFGRGQPLMKDNLSKTSISQLLMTRFWSNFKARFQDQQQQQTKSNIRIKYMVLPLKRLVLLKKIINKSRHSWVKS